VKHPQNQADGLLIGIIQIDQYIGDIKMITKNKKVSFFFGAGAE